MAKAIENHKGFLVLEISRQEMIDKCGSLGICDYCNGPASKGYYVAVLNRWYCPACYKHFINTATRYEEDIPIEKAHYKHYCKLFGVKLKAES